MQLIATLLLPIALSLLIASLLFALHAKRRLRHRMEILHRGYIGGCGVSMVSLYPTSLTPLKAMLNEDYPRCEAIVVCDMQRNSDTFTEAIEEYHLIKVNHSQFPHIRTLYRSRHRAFRRVVLIDLPFELQQQAREVAHDVASYGNILYTQRDMVVEEGVATYVANLIAKNFDEQPLLIQSIVGEEASLVSSASSPTTTNRIVLSDRVLAWQQVPWWWLTTTAVPLLLATIAALYRSWLLLLDSVLLSLSLLPILYISCCIVTKKGVLALFATIIRNFYRYIIDLFKKFHYLYKRCDKVPPKR